MKKEPTRDRAAQRHDSLSRRQVLRGLGASIALPTLMSASPAFAKSLPRQVPARMAFVYVPNGAIPAAWWPEGAGGADFGLSPTLAPLAKVRNSLQVISGLDCVSAEAGPDGAGDHARAGGTFLTGVRIKKTAGSDIKAGVSIDQVVANEVGHRTRFASLELTCDVVRKSGECDSGYACAYEYNLAWSAPNQPLAPEHNPQFAFERLFGDGSRNARVANLKRRESEQHSILDYVLEDAKSLNAKLDGRDRQKLDQYLTSVRELEMTLKAAPAGGGRCSPDFAKPERVPNTNYYSDWVKGWYSIIGLALKCDLTRNVTFMLGHGFSNQSYGFLGINNGVEYQPDSMHHIISHHGGNAGRLEKLRAIDKHTFLRFSYLAGSCSPTAASSCSITSSLVLPSAWAWKLVLTRCRSTGMATFLMSSTATLKRPSIAAIALAPCTR